jgi:hypothetical protein
MTVTDTLVVELTYVHNDISEEEMMDEKQYESFFKSFDGMAADDAHVKKLKHFVNEED